MTDKINNNFEFTASEKLKRNCFYFIPKFEA